MQQMSDTTMVVATRYHNIVCALKMGKPTISLGYADKNSALMTEFGLSDFCQEISSFDVDRLKAQTERLLEGRSTFEAKIAEARGRVEADLREQEALIVSLL